MNSPYPRYLERQTDPSSRGEIGPDWRDVLDRPDIVRAMASWGWASPWLPPKVAEALSQFESTPSYRTALLVEAAVNSFTSEPILRAGPERVESPAGIRAGTTLVSLANPQLVQTATLTSEEARAALLILDMLYTQGRAGASAENVFTWGEGDTYNDAATRAFYKMFRAAGRPTPSKLDHEVDLASKVKADV